MSDEDLDIPRNERAALSRTPQRRRVLPVVLLVMLLVAGGLVGWQYFAAVTQQGAQQDIPIVRAEPGPVKVRPEDPGGMRIPNQDKLVYGRLGETGEPRVERLMPPSEQPMTPPQPAPAPPETAVPETAMPGEPGSMTPPTAPEAEAPAAGQSARMTLPTDTAARREAMTQAETVPPPPPPPPAESPVSPAPRSQPSPASPPAAETPAPAPAPRQEPEAPKAAAAPATGDWMLQLGALRTEDAARAEWQRLQKGHQDLLGGLDLDVQRAEVPQKGTFYRIRVGPVADREAGDALCGKLALRKIGCFVVKR